MPIALWFLISLCCLSTATATATSRVKNQGRHLLHQPFIPVEAVPPTQPPLSSPQPQPRPTQQPKLPFTSSSSTPPPQKPFFPSFHSPPSPPPPSSPTALSSFPANISSLLFPQSSSSSTSHRHVIAIAVSVSLLSAGLIIASSAALLYYFRHRKLQDNPTGDKESRSDSLRLYPPNTATSDGDAGPNKSRGGTPNTSSEFLYLGTLVSSRGGGDQETKANSSINAGVKIGESGSPYRKLGSPELIPLPPLPKTNSYFKHHSFKNPRVGGVDDGDDGGGDGDGEEEFFSPRGSTESPSSNGSSSQKVLQSFEVENLGNRSFNLRTPSYPYSKSASPATSVSNTLSPTSNLSPY